MKQFIWAHFQTLRRELKIWHAAQVFFFFWQTATCLEMWSNTVLIVWLLQKFSLSIDQIYMLCKAFKIIYISANQVSVFMSPFTKMTSHNLPYPSSWNSSQNNPILKNRGKRIPQMWRRLFRIPGNVIVNFKYLVGTKSKQVQVILTDVGIQG